MYSQSMQHLMNLNMKKIQAYLLKVIRYKEKMQGEQINLSKQHLQILSYTDNLFTRWSLRKNSYLFKHLKPNLQIPLFIIAEERRIAQITQSQSTIIQALKLTQFVNVNEETRVVKLVELPTLKFWDQSALLSVETAVKKYVQESAIKNSKKPLEYIISNKTDDGFYYLILKTKDPADKQVLEQVANSIGEKSYLVQPLYQQLKQIHSKLRKSKRDNHSEHRQHKQYNNTANSNINVNKNVNEVEINNPVYSRNNMMHPWMYYSMYGMSPEQMQIYAIQQQQSTKTYGIFIRKAVDSDEQNQPVTMVSQNKQQIVQASENKTSKESEVKLQSEPQKQVIESKQKQTPNKKKYDAKGKGEEQKEKKSHMEKQKEKQKIKNKVIIDDNDFPSIG